jgi:uncharacterized protein (TIGR02118 family)
VEKFITAFKRHPEMPVEAFRDHWTTVHAKKVSRLPGIRRYVQNTPHDSAYSRGREPAFDAVAEVWFDAGRLDGLAATAEFAAVREDASTFTDRPSVVRLPVDEIPLIDGPYAPLKLVMFVRRRSGLTVARFQDHWRDVHGPIAARNPFMRRYVQCHVRECAAGAAPAAFDGVGMVWFDTRDDVRASATTPEAAEVSEDGARFADGGGPSATLLVSEAVVVA